jgi:hypothetical protein
MCSFFPTVCVATSALDCSDAILSDLYRGSHLKDSFTSWKCLQLSAYTEATTPQQLIAAVEAYQDAVETAAATAYASTLTGAIASPPCLHNPCVNATDEV